MGEKHVRTVKYLTFLLRAVKGTSQEEVIRKELEERKKAEHGQEEQEA